MQVSSSDFQIFLDLLVAATHRNSEIYGKFLVSKEASSVASLQPNFKKDVHNSGFILLANHCDWIYISLHDLVGRG